LASHEDDPIALFQDWFRDAFDSGMKEPSAMTVATVDPSGYPDARMMLLKGVDDRGFVFYTNVRSAKARALMHDPRVALCFYWVEIGKQVRVRGQANIVTDEEADAYFATRPRLSQISAWASKQSQPMRVYYELEAQVAKAALHFGLREVPRRSGQDFDSCRKRWNFGFRKHFAVISAFSTDVRPTVGKSAGCIRNLQTGRAITAQQNATDVHRPDTAANRFVAL